MTSRTLIWTAAAAIIVTPMTVARAQDPSPNAAATQDAPALKDDKDKTSYAVGMNLGSAIRRDSSDLDVRLIVQGLEDAFANGKTLLTEAEMRATLTRLQAQLKGKQETARTEKAAQARTQGEAFLAENKTKEGVVTLASGLQYKILKKGDGKSPAVSDTVVCHYRGTLIDGTEFDSSYKRNKPATLALNRVIKGWSEALQLMPAGSRWQLFVPPNLAYGERGAGARIGPNTTLIFEIELISIQSATTTQAAPRTRPSAATSTDVGAAASSLAGINVSFKLDPRITKGLYMGERWVPPPYTQGGDGNQVTVEARAVGIDGSGKSVNANATWITANPKVATVTPREGRDVTITVQRPGETSVRVTSNGVARELTIKAEKKGSALQVVISPKG
jgi:FKBP-type peptidyl-prolyl cis-trans isomerase